jgi:hypothetical protein
MNKYVIVIAIFVLQLYAITPALAENIGMNELNQVPVMSVVEQTEDFTKIEISPQYGNLRLQPGEDKELTVMVRNKEKKTVSVNPNIMMLPYGGYTVDTEWILITPKSADIPAGGSQKFTVKASVPKDASVGYSSLQIAFTDEVMPTPSPQPYSNYVHAFQLSVDIWKKPDIQIMMPYINDQLEASKEYDYEVNLKNTGDMDIRISPKLGSDDMYFGGPYGMTTSALTEDSIMITAPGSIPAGTTGTVKIHVKVPAETKGYYNGYIDLGIDDPSVREGEGRVQLSFNIWKQPAEPFVRSFIMEEEAPIHIELSSTYYYGFPISTGANANEKEPSFETTLTGPGGNAELKVLKTVIKGNVNMGGDRPPWEIDSASIYQEMGVQHIVTYGTGGSPGEWKLNVLPRNMQGFDYSITIGE